MQKLLILGSNGFVGRNLKEYFEKKNRYLLLCPSSKELDCVSEDAVREYLEKHKVDVVIHAAVYNPKENQPKIMERKLEFDLRMFFNFEKYSHLYNKMIYFGSGAEYDKTNSIVDVVEECFEKDIPHNDYGLAKYIINKRINESKNIYNFRLFGLFGKYENWKLTFISGACCKAVKNLPITIRQNVYFDYLYVEDFCEIVDKLLHKDLKYHEYNLVSGSKVDLETIAQIVKETSGNNIPIYICKDGLANEYTASNRRLLEELGGYEFTSMEDAVKDLYRWYEEQKEQIDMMSLLYQ